MSTETRETPMKPYTRTEQVQTTLRPEEKQQLDAYAATLPASRADAIRRLILEGLPQATEPAQGDDEAERVAEYQRTLRELRKARAELR